MNKIDVLIEQPEHLQFSDETGLFKKGMFASPINHFNNRGQHIRKLFKFVKVDETEKSNK
jgi:hypothetical protein